MRNRRFLGGLSVGLVILSLGLAGCGSAGPAAPSGLDPARMAPASSLLYFSMTVRPQGSQRTQVEATLHKLFGKRADPTIRQAIQKLMRKAGATYNGDVKPWLGQRIGVVITQFTPGAPNNGVSPSAVALIAPTQNPSAARAFIAKVLKHSPGTDGKVIGHYAVYGGALAYQEILATTPANSLAASPGYQATVSQLPSNASAVFYMNTRKLVAAVMSKFKQLGALGAAVRNQLARIGPNAAVAAGLTLTPSAVSLDTAVSGIRPGPPGHGAAANVGNLPAGAWLALDTGGNIFSPQSVQRMVTGFRAGFLGALSQSPLAGSPGASAVAQRLAVIQQFLPALGPLSVSLGGTSPLNLAAGLKLTPTSMAAATRLLELIHALAAHSASLNVTGNATRFSIGVPTGSSVIVDETGKNVVATYGFLNQRAFLAPSAKLSSDPTYQHALSQLPAGSSVPLYVSFGPIASIVSLVDHKPSAAKTEQVLNRLSYLIAGGHSGHDRVVLGLK